MKYKNLSAALLLFFMHASLTAGMNKFHFGFALSSPAANRLNNYNFSSSTDRKFAGPESGTDYLLFQDADLSFIYLSTITADSAFNSKIEEPKGNISREINEDYKWYNMFTNVPKDDYLFLKNIFRTDNIPVFIGLTLLSGSLAMVDKSGWRYNHSLYVNSKFFHKTSDIAVFMGNGEFHFILSGLFASFGLIENNEVALKTAGNIVESVLSAGLFVQVLKRMTGRESPAASDWSPGDFKFFPSIKEYQKQQAKYYSFPSGHLASATATLTVIANNYPQIKWIKPVGYTFLGILGFSLVSEGMHWYSDLPLGFFIGYTFGNIISPVQSSSDRLTKDNENSKLLLTPSIGSNRIGLDLSYDF